MPFARNGLLGAAFVLGNAAGASAADLGEVSLKDAPVLETPAPSGWYARVDGGYNWFPNPSFDFTGSRTADSKHEGAWSVGGGIGRYIGGGLRGDITVDHLFGSDAETSILAADGSLVGGSKFELSSTVVLANLYYDFNRGGGFNPYVGGGIGYANNNISSGTFSTQEVGGKSTDNFAAAAMAGISWRLRGGGTTYVSGLKGGPVIVEEGHALYLDFGYRFLYLGDAETAAFDADGVTSSEKLKTITAQQIRLGLRYDLN